MNRRQLEGLASAPILGQSFTIVGHYATVLIQCACEAKSPLIIVGNSRATCAACGERFAIGDQGSATVGVVPRPGAVHG